MAFDADPQLFQLNNRYVVVNKGNPLDFVLGVISPSSRETDRVTIREFCASMRAPEYRRIDDIAEQPGLGLAGGRLVDDSCQPVSVTKISEEVLRGYGAALNPIPRWDHGQPVFIHAATQAPVLTCEYQVNRAERESELRATAEAESDREAARANRADEKTRQLEEESRRIRGF